MQNRLQRRGWSQAQHRTEFHGHWLYRARPSLLTSQEPGTHACLSLTVIASLESDMTLNPQFGNRKNLLSLNFGPTLGLTRRHGCQFVYFCGCLDTHNAHGRPQFFCGHPQVFDWRPSCFLPLAHPRYFWTWKNANHRLNFEKSRALLCGTTAKCSKISYVKKGNRGPSMLTPMTSSHLFLNGRQRDN